MIYGSVGDTAELRDGKAEIYRVIAPKAEMKMKKVCAEEALCPTLTTCVENEFLFEKELKTVRGALAFDKLYSRASGGAAQYLGSAAWTDKNTDFMAADYAYKFPKVLVSEHRTEAL